MLTDVQCIRVHKLLAFEGAMALGLALAVTLNFVGLECSGICALGLVVYIGRDLNELQLLINQGDHRYHILNGRPQDACLCTQEAQQHHPKAIATPVQILNYRRGRLLTMNESMNTLHFSAIPPLCNHNLQQIYGTNRLSAHA